MRRALLLVTLLACSKGGDKPAPGSETKPGAEPTGGESGKKEKTVKGTLTFGGALTGSATWKPDLYLTCACINEKNWQLDTVMSGDNDLSVAITVNSTIGIKMTGSAGGQTPIVELLHSEGNAGISGGCKPDNVDTDGVIAFDLDAKVTGKAGEVTVKGHLDVVCRRGP